METRCLVGRQQAHGRCLPRSGPAPRRTPTRRLAWSSRLSSNTCSRRQGSSRNSNERACQTARQDLVISCRSRRPEHATLRVRISRLGRAQTPGVMPEVRRAAPRENRAPAESERRTCDAEGSASRAQRHPSQAAAGQLRSTHQGLPARLPQQRMAPGRQGQGEALHVPELPDPRRAPHQPGPRQHTPAEALTGHARGLLRPAPHRAPKTNRATHAQVKARRQTRSGNQRGRAGSQATALPAHRPQDPRHAAQGAVRCPPQGQDRPQSRRGRRPARPQVRHESTDEDLDRQGAADLPHSSPEAPGTTPCGSSWPPPA